MKPDLTPAYWTERYRASRDGWDLGGANLGLLEEVTSRVNPTQRVLIPGAGRGYEAEWLWQAGYDQVYVCDWSELALARLASSLYLPKADRLLVGDFFELSGRFDVIIEQTFFCAIDPSQRERYVDQCADLLTPGGLLIGVLFDKTFSAGPPFGGSRAEYADAFGRRFAVNNLAEFQGSVAPRRGSEVLLVARQNT